MSWDPAEGWHRRDGMALLTDLYQLTMMAGYWRTGRADKPVAFNYFFRSLPPHAGFAVSTGLESFLDYCESLRFSESDIAYLRKKNLFPEDFLQYLMAYRPRFTVEAAPEGSLVYPYEPILQVTGTLFETQLIETALLNIVNHQTLIATKASRVCLAAEGDPVIEFGLRRAHGPDGGISGSRAAYIGGCASTSNVLAGKIFDIPIAGTHAHSWIMSYDSELEAFREFARLYPERCILLVDTYDTVNSGVPNAIRVFQEMHEDGIPVRPAIRLDSGDLAKFSKQAFEQMQTAGFEDPLIVASNDLDEDLIADLKRQGAKINAWGVGTHLITAYDAPAFPGVYKLVGIQEDKQWHPRLKVASNAEKSTEPGQKRLVRYYSDDGRTPVGDVVYLADEELLLEGVPVGRGRTQPQRRQRLPRAASGEPLLREVFREGKRTAPRQSASDIRDFVLAQIAVLPEEFKRLRNPEIYRVLLSESLSDLKDKLIEAHLKEVEP